MFGVCGAPGTVMSMVTSGPVEVDGNGNGNGRRGRPAASFVRECSVPVHVLGNMWVGVGAPVCVFPLRRLSDACMVCHAALFPRVLPSFLPSLCVVVLHLCRALLCGHFPSPSAFPSPTLHPPHPLGKVALRLL
jgi:hypothetical protein